MLELIRCSFLFLVLTVDTAYLGPVPYLGKSSPPQVSMHPLSLPPSSCFPGKDKGINTKDKDRHTQYSRSSRRQENVMRPLGGGNEIISPGGNIAIRAGMTAIFWT
jgi:hypothetical protein